MNSPRHRVSDAQRVVEIKALLHDIDVVLCLHPFVFMAKQLATAIGMDSSKRRYFFSSRQEALSILQRAINPHLVVISETLRDGSGIDLLREIKRLNPQHRCIVILHESNRNSQRLARQLHADACIDEGSLQEQTGALIEALKAIQRQQKYVDTRLQSLDQPGPSKKELPLSERQHEILKWVAEGLSNREIAAQLNITTNTVHDHWSEIMRRLEVSNRASAVATAFRLGLLP